MSESINEQSRFHSPYVIFSWAVKRKGDDPTLPENLDFEVPAAIYFYSDDEPKGSVILPLKELLSQVKHVYEYLRLDQWEEGDSDE